MTQVIIPKNSGDIQKYANIASFPVGVFDGELGLALDTDVLYSYDLGSTTWVVIGGAVGDHALASHLAYADSGHTGFQPTITAGTIKANYLQAVATDLGAANVTINLSNSNGAFVTNVTTDGTIIAGAFAGPLTGNVTGNADTVTTNANLTGPVTSTGNATAIASGAIKANMLQAAAADLGAANVEIVLSNSNGAFVTNVTTDGSFSGLTYKVGATQVVGAQVAALGLDAKADAAKITDIIAALRAHGLLGPNA